MSDDNIRAADDYKVERLIDPPGHGQSYGAYSGMGQGMGQSFDQVDDDLAAAIAASLHPSSQISDLELAIAASLRDICKNCSLGDNAQVYVMCDNCGTMIIKALTTYSTSLSSKLCTSCGQVNSDLEYGNCVNRHCEALVKLGPG